MKAKDAAHEVIKAIGELKGCYPKDSEEAEALNAIVAAVVDLIYGGQIGGQSDERTKTLSNLLGENANRRLKLAAARREIDDAVLDTLEKNALLDNVVQQARKG